MPSKPRKPFLPSTPASPLKPPIYKIGQSVMALHEWSTKPPTLAYGLIVEILHLPLGTSYRLKGSPDWYDEKNVKELR